MAVGWTLTSLDLSGCSVLTDAGLAAVSKHCQVIESLKVSFCPNITGQKLKPLFNCPRRGPDFKTFVANGCKMVSVYCSYTLNTSHVITKQGFFLRIQNLAKPQAFDSVVESLSGDGVGCFPQWSGKLVA